MCSCLFVYVVSFIQIPTDSKIKEILYILLNKAADLFIPAFKNIIIIYKF